MLNFDRQITISAANSRNSTIWSQQVLYWSEFVDRLHTPARGAETLAQYLALPKSKQDDLKDIGGFVGGTFKNNRRKAHLCAGRDIITLDMDSIKPGGTGDVLRRLDGLGCAYAVYSTRKHEDSKPRLRVLVPTDRTATGEEYIPLALKLAAIIGIEMCDPTTFRIHQLMYWPSCCSDSQYVYTYGDKGFLAVDGMLALYSDWRNMAEWPEVPGAQQVNNPRAVKQEDPAAKSGPVGAFCKVYNIYQAMDQFIPGIYMPCDDNPERFTFSGGSTTGGAVIYDNGTFLYSHHATDPAGGKLVNAFDLIRLHLFQDKDDEAKPETPVNKLPSFMAMCQLAVSDQAVASLLNQERYEKAVTEFNNGIGIPNPNMPVMPGMAVEDINWVSKLKLNSNTGLPLKTASNILVILENDPLLKGKIAYDEFANKGVVLGALPWDGQGMRRFWVDHDGQGLRIYLEKIYDLSCPNKVEDALGDCMYRHTFNDIVNYLTSLSWDGIPRIDTLLIDYLGADDNPYVRTVTRKSLIAAVARAMTPGVKFDNVLILVGPQRIGKSTLLRILGRNWFSDSLTSFEGKDAAELIQGVWINELGELSSLNRSETNIAKQFLSRTDDIYRAPFGKKPQRYPRRCVFFGTTNESEFLKDQTGNGRFWPVKVRINQPTKNVFSELPFELDQVWAEAFVKWRLGEPLFLSEEIEALANMQQEMYTESSTKEGIIREFIDRPVPPDWNKRTIAERRMYWGGEFGRPDGETRIRDRICAAEIWCEALNGDLKYLKRSDTIEINNIIAKIRGWERYNNSFPFGPYGAQKGFIKTG